ncbi:phage terminase small subunit [Sphingomonas phyllosphaerae]|uniref:phage terminase small subunit n=1 Tax=Sphingomonas phyllosphaerae TaxID=257003 RepID=UPI0024137DDA|nr:phage terminase small subunit [Sphingomonas phyllosphaerae]
MSLARRHREYIAALSGGSRAGTPAPAASGSSPAARQIQLRLQHDLRRLKDIKSVAAKIAAKRKILPAYHAWVDGALAAATPEPADEVLPTVMVWSIDVGDWGRALALAEHVLRYDLPLPARYQRDAATLVLEEIAEAALRDQARGEPFPLAVLEQVEALVDGVDMHDEPRAKLQKAIAAELARAADAAAAPAARALTERAIAALDAAQRLDERAGVKTQRRALEKALAALPPATDCDTDTDTAGATVPA